MCFPIINIASYIEHNNTVDRETFAGVNICGFSSIEVFMEILSHSLGHKCSLFSTIKERCLNSWKNFCGTPENRENRKSLAQQIFPRLRYCIYTKGYSTVPRYQGFILD